MDPATRTVYLASQAGNGDSLLGLAMGNYTFAGLMFVGGLALLYIAWELINSIWEAWYDKRHKNKED